MMYCDAGHETLWCSMCAPVLLAMYYTHAHASAIQHYSMQLVCCVVCRVVCTVTHSAVLFVV